MTTKKLYVPGRYRLAPAQVTDFSRASTATYLGADGLIKTAAINEPRFEGAELVLERAAVNILPTSESSAGWFSNAPNTPIPGAILGMNGTSIISGSVPGLDAHRRAAIGVAAGTRLCASMYVDVATMGLGFTGRLTLWSADVDGAQDSRIYFRKDGSVVSTSTFGANVTGSISGVAQVSGSIYRVWVSAVFTKASTTNPRLYAKMNTDAQAFAIGLPQIERDVNVPTSYIPSGATATVRAADAAREILADGAAAPQPQLLQIGVNGNNDIYLDAHNNLVMVDDLDATMQGAQQAAQAQRGEMQYHLDRGVPNMQVVWSGHPSAAQLRAAIRQELLLATGVAAVNTLNVQLRDEAAVYTADITTVFGPGVLNNE